MAVVRTKSDALTGCRWMVILTTKPVVYKNAGATGNQDGCPASGTRPWLFPARDGTCGPSIAAVTLPCCTADTPRNGEPRGAITSMKHEQTQKSAILPWARKTAGNTSRQIARACLATVDWYHRTSLHAKQGERAVARTKRITFSEDLRRRVSANQGHRCMYCGVALLRLNKTDGTLTTRFQSSTVAPMTKATCKQRATVAIREKGFRLTRSSGNGTANCWAAHKRVGHQRGA